MESAQLIIYNKICLWSVEMQDFQADFFFASYLGGTHSTFVPSAFGFPAVAVIFLSLPLFANNAGMNCSTRI